MHNLPNPSELHEIQMGYAINGEVTFGPVIEARIVYLSLCAVRRGVIARGVKIIREDGVPLVQDMTTGDYVGKGRFVRGDVVVDFIRMRGV